MIKLINYNLFQKVLFIFFGIIFLGIITYAATEINDIGTSNIDGLLTIGNLVTNFVNTTHILDRTITADDIADSSINDTHLSVTGFPERLGSGILTVESTAQTTDDANSSNLTINEGIFNINDILRVEFIGGNLDSLRSIVLNIGMLDVTTPQRNVCALDTVATPLSPGELIQGACDIFQSPNPINNTFVYGHMIYSRTNIAQANFEETTVSELNTGEANPLTSAFTLSVEGSYSSTGSTQNSNVSWIAYRYAF